MSTRPHPEGIEGMIAAQLRRLRARLDEAERHSGETKARVLPRMAEAETTISRQQTEITAQAGHITSLGQRVTSAEGAIAQHGQTITAQGQTITAQGQTITAQGQTITAQGQTISDLSGRLTTAENRINSLRTEVGTHMQGIPHGLWQEIGSLRARVYALEHRGSGL